jgi:hypothetical protein
MSAVDPQFAADFTDRFAPFLNPLPEVNTFREFLRFAKSSDRSGKQFRYPVQAAISHGQTTDRTGTAFTLKSARPGVELEAILDGTDLIVRETFPYSAMLKARNGVSINGDAAAYWDPLDKVMMTTLRAMEYYNELMLMYGPGSTTTGLSNIGVIATVPVISGGPNYNSGTHPVVQLTHASWGAGIWNNAGSGGGANSGMLVDVYQSDLTTLRAANIQIEGVVDPSLCQIQMTGSSAAAVTASDVLVPAGWINTTSVGVGGILRNTGTFANISATTNPFWRCRTLNMANAAMTASKFLAITAKLMANGGKNGLTAWCNPIVFSDLVDGTVNNTRWNNSMGDNKVKMQGAETLQFMTAVGVCTLKRHEYMKQGEMWLLEPETCMRIGASDITFRGANGNEGFFLELTGSAGSEIRAMSQQAALLTVPYHNAIITGIKSPNADISAGDVT